MQIPVSLIVLRATNGSNATKYQPAYVAKLYRAVWGKRLDERDGLEVLPVSPDLPESARYREVTSIASEEQHWMSYFSYGRIPGQAIDPAIEAMFRQVFPDGLRGEIATLMADEMVRLKAATASAQALTAHQSYLDLGLTPSTALQLQKHGWATAASAPRDFLSLTEAGFSLTEADVLLSKLNAPREAQTTRVAATKG